MHTVCRAYNNFSKRPDPVDRCSVACKLSPGLSLDIDCERSASSSAFERLLEHVQLLVQFGILLAFGGDLAHRMQHGRVVSPVASRLA